MTKFSQKGFDEWISLCNNATYKNVAHQLDAKLAKNAPLLFTSMSASFKKNFGPDLYLIDSI